MKVFLIIFKIFNPKFADPSVDLPRDLMWRANHSGWQDFEIVDTVEKSDCVIAQLGKYESTDLNKQLADVIKRKLPLLVLYREGNYVPAFIQNAEKQKLLMLLPYDRYDWMRIRSEYFLDELQKARAANTV